MVNGKRRKVGKRGRVVGWEMELTTRLGPRTGEDWRMGEKGWGSAGEGIGNGRDAEERLPGQEERLKWRGKEK